jgi:hypothetical protein
MAKVAPEAVRKADRDSLWRDRCGRALQRAVSTVGWTLNEFATAVDRDPRQCRRWIDGEDRQPFDLLLTVEALREPLIVALAIELHSEDVEVETVVHIRRRA